MVADGGPGPRAAIVIAEHDSVAELDSRMAFVAAESDIGRGAERSKVLAAYHLEPVDLEASWLGRDDDPNIASVMDRGGCLSQCFLSLPLVFHPDLTDSYLELDTDWMEGNPPIHVELGDV